MDRDRELIATKDFSYGTRRLRAGDRFPTTDRDARILIAIGKAEEPRNPGRVPAPSGRLMNRAMSALDHDGNGKKGGSTGAADHMRALRREYEKVVGKKPFSGWDEAPLREKMADAGK